MIIVVPRYRAQMTSDEALSLRHLETFLDSYDRVFLSPDSLAFPSKVPVVRFADHYFTSVDTYSRLLLTPAFYRAFDGYEYILIYQLDCLVFSDQLGLWCDADWDYVGAPWLVDPDQPDKGFSRVGNGGFSLRRTEACLRALVGATEANSFIASWSRLLRAPLPDLEPGQWRRRLQVLREARRGANWYAGSYSLNEDRFWSDRARLFDPEFRVAPVSEALKFSFESAPRFCFAQNGNELPFGCHAWKKWDPSFWQPFLLRHR